MVRALPLLLLLSGCGGFDNAPLRLGEVKGQFTVSSSNAFVAVLGVPESKRSVDASGEFQLGGLTAGTNELLVVGGDYEAARFEVQVDAARVLDLGTVPLFPAGEIELFPKAPDHQKVSGEVMTVEGTPWQQVPPNSEQRLEVEGVPRGCWTVTAAVPGFASRTFEVCLNQGETKKVDVLLAAPDGTEGQEGCRVSGCELGYACENDGACR